MKALQSFYPFLVIYFNIFLRLLLLPLLLLPDLDYLGQLPGQPSASEEWWTEDKITVMRKPFGSLAACNTTCSNQALSQASFVVLSSICFSWDYWWAHHNSHNPGLLPSTLILPHSLEGIKFQFVPKIASTAIHLVCLQSQTQTSLPHFHYPSSLILVIEEGEIVWFRMPMRL